MKANYNNGSPAEEFVICSLELKTFNPAITKIPLVEVCNPQSYKTFILNAVAIGLVFNNYLNNV